MTTEQNSWPKVITVDRNIVKILSESTYENFPNALKEIITNSYDASSTSVEIVVDIENEIVIVQDNGVGMDEKDYDFYLRIAGKRREIKQYTDSGRVKIGQFGVGFLSVFPFFQNYSIESKRANMKYSMYADIPCSKYFDDDNKLINVSDIKINGGRRFLTRSSTEHYTKITLSGFSNITKEFFNPSINIKRNRYSIKNEKYFTSLQKLSWLLTEDLPLEYEDDYFNKLFASTQSKLPFQVTLNGDILKRKVYATERILEEHSQPFSQIGRIKFQYFISTNGEAIRPIEARYIKIRNLNAGVGNRTYFEIPGGHSRLQQLTGELHILEGLNDLIKVSRDGFNYSPDYEELQVFFAKKLIDYSLLLENEANQEKENDPRRVRSLRNIQPIDVFTISAENNIPQTFPVEKSKMVSGDKPSYENSFERPINSTNVTKEILHPVEQQTRFEEKPNYFEFANQQFKVISDEWDYLNSDFPACRLDSKILILNSKYPLFKGVKHTDVFIKMHVFLLVNFQSDLMSKEAYLKMSKQVLNIYDDYWNNK